MKLDDDFDLEYKDYTENRGSFRSGSSFVYSVVIVSIVFLFILVCVLITNRGTEPENPGIYTASSDAVSDNLTAADSGHGVDELISGSTLTAADLDFWHDYDDELKEDNQNAALSGTGSLTAVSSDTAGGYGSTASGNDPSSDGRHTLITYSDGRTEWLEINPYLVRNKYNFSNLVYTNGLMKYYDNYVKSSFNGVTVSSLDEFVDFGLLKNAGIDFVMLRIGQRGYSTGEILPDESFEDNYRRAKEAGLDIGIYFNSYAVSKEEGIEEADFVINTLQSVSADSITYPVAFYIEEVNSNDDRSETVNQLLRTNIAIAYMDTLRNAGYVPIVYGNKEYLLKKLSFGSLIGYDIWLGEEGDLPDFPYEFNMWSYNRLGKINGMNGTAHMIISFTDYHSR